jgi:hypothetical protein
MARPRPWLPDVPQLIRTVERSKQSHFPRKDIQRIFAIQPRAAGKLLALFPQVEGSLNTHMVKRELLLAFLQAVRDAPDPDVYLRGLEGRQKISRKRPRVLVMKDLLEESTLATLPRGITLERGRLVVTFTSEQELGNHLAAFAGAWERERVEFFERYVPESDEDRERQAALELEREDMRRIAAYLAEAQAPRKPPQAAPSEDTGDLTAQAWAAS